MEEKKFRLPRKIKKRFKNASLLVKDRYDAEGYKYYKYYSNNQ